MSELSDVRRMKIMMICAHPGDAFDDSGGTLCHHIERGDDVIVVLMTTGARSHAAKFTDEKRKPKGQRIEEYAAMTAECCTYTAIGRNPSRSCSASVPTKPSRTTNTRAPSCKPWG